MWLFVSCQPCDELLTCSGCTLPSPIVSWDWLQPLGNPRWDKAVEDENKGGLNLNQLKRLELISAFKKNENALDGQTV